MMRSFAFVVLAIGCGALRSMGQVIPVFPPVNFGNGVYIDADGSLHQRQVDNAGELAAQRVRAKTLNQPPKGQDLTYVSLPPIFEVEMRLTETKK
jgi:hypothetical protein